RRAPIADHERDPSRKFRIAADAQQRLQVGAGARHEHPHLGAVAHRSETLGAPPGEEMTLPIVCAAIPASESSPSASSGGITATMPTPMLNVRHISSGLMPPACCSAKKRGGT